jgi:hypothetical protein
MTIRDVAAQRWRNMTKAGPRDATNQPALGIILYDGVEPIDVGRTISVVSMVARILLASKPSRPRKPPVRSLSPTA